MNNTFSNDQVSKPKKVLTAVFVVGVLLVSAIIINSIQSKTNLEAQTGFFSRILSSIFRDRLDPLKRIPKDSLTFADQGNSEGNVILSNDNGDFVFNINNPEGIQALAIKPDETGSITIPDVVENPEESFIVTFKADPLATKTRELLEERGTELLPRDTNKGVIDQEIKTIAPQISAHKSIILAQQNGLLNKLSTRYGSAVSDGKEKVFSTNSRDIRVRQLQTTLNAVTISNITEDELKEIVRTVPNVARVEKARGVKADLIETPSIIHSEELSTYFGANGVPLTGEGTIIAIVDTGVDYTHQDLGNCSFLIEGGCKVAYGYDFVNNDSDPMDDHGHGTHVAATAGGNGYYTQPNGDTNPLPGIAPQATIYAYKVLSASGSGSNIGVIQGIEACADPNGDGDISDRVTVCSLSLGSSGGDPLDADALAADAAVDAGVIMTIAAGNSGPSSETIGSPGTSRKAITVGAACKPSDIGDDSKCSTPVASFSSRGPVNYIEDGQAKVLNKPDIVSPGVNICAAQWGDWMQGKSCLGDNEHIAINGTSMATPTVAGLMALLAQAHPDKTVAELKDTLMAAATDLGLDVNTQGQGLVDGVTTLEGLGIPNSILGIEGLPFYIEDLSGEQVSTFSKTFTLSNISEQVLNLSVSQETENEGVTLSFPASISIQPGDEIDFPVSVTIDHAIAHSGLNVKEIIAFSNGEEVVNLVIARRTPDYLVPESNFVDFGLFHESSTTFSETRTITLSNRMLEQEGVYSVSVEPYSVSSLYQDNISVTTSVDEVTVGAGGTVSFDVTIDAFSQAGNSLKNDTYSTFLTLQSETETISIKLSFFRGYAFEMVYGEEAPSGIILAGNTFQLVFYPNPQMESITLKATKPGPYSAMAVYLDDDSDFTETTGIFEFDMYFGNSQGVVTYDVSKNKAEHRIENHYSGNICSWRIGEETGAINKNFGFLGGGKISFEYNSLPENMDFSLACMDLMPNNNRILVSQIYLTEGLNQDFSLNDTTAEISSRYMYAFDNREDQNTVGIGVNLCNFRNYNHPGAVKTVYNMCSFWNNESGDLLTLSEGETGVIEVRSLHTDTPESSATPNYPSFRIHAFDPDTISSPFYVSPQMFGTESKLYAWSDPYSGALSTTETSGSMYQDNKINIVNDNFITLGTAPIVDTTMAKVYQNEFAFLTAFNNNFINPYRYADGSSESVMLKNPNPVKVLYSFLRSGLPVASSLVDMESIIAPFFFAGTLVPDSSGNTSTTGYGGPELGSYEVTLDRIAKQNGEDQNGVFKTQSSFSISESSVDSIPPFLEGIQLVASGILQNYFDPANPGELRVFVNPGYGILSHSLEDDENGAYEIEFMEDTISSFIVRAGDSTDSMSDITSVTSSGENYVISLEGVSASSERKYFEISLEDSGGNSTTYNFYLETGLSLDPLDLANESLLFCQENQPLVTISDPVVVLDSGGEYVAVDFSVTNQDSLACQPSLFNLTFDTDQYDPLPNDSYTIRGTEGDPGNGTFNTTGFQISFGSIHPGQISTPKTAYFRADEFLSNGEYQIGLMVNNSSQSLSYPVSFFASVTGAELSPDVTCGRVAPTITPIGNIASHSNSIDVLPKSYQMSITNNDDETCDPTTFKVTITDDSPEFGTKKSQVNINGTSQYDMSWTFAPGQTITSNVFYKNLGVEDAIIPLDIQIEDTTMSGSYHDPIVFDGSITYGTPPLPNYCDADFSGDGQVGTTDQLLFNGGYGTSNSTYDLDGNGFVNAPDLILFLSYYGGTGCPVTDPITEEESSYNNIANDPSIIVSYDVEASFENGSNIYDYEITITNSSSEDKNNLVAYNLIPVSQAPFAEFIAASVPGIEVDTDTDALLIPSLDGGQAISIFITVTMPSS